MRIFSLFYITMLFAINISAQVKDEWFPSGLTIKPFQANMLEPKAGFSYMPWVDRLRLDISTSQDFYRGEKGSNVFSFGGDLFTYTRLRAENDFHFPVETIDYMFGVNGCYKVVNESDEYGFRLRLSHISAHLVDGKYDSQILNWSAGDRPIVYSKEYVELFPYYSYKGLRGYIGLTYLFHVTPTNIGKEIYQAGLDYEISWLRTGLFTPFAAYDLKLNKIDKYLGNNIVTAGLKFGNAFGKGMSIAYTYYSGRSIHGEYYDRYENYSAIGLNLDF
jgi:hypothetical protein